MYSISQLTHEIRATVDERIERKEPIQPNWIAQQILGNHSLIEGHDTDFYQCVAYETVREQVRKQISRFKLAPEQAAHVNRQLVLPGYERLQAFYLIESDGEQIAIPLVRMTSAQRKAKTDELRTMGDGCHQHADELERYDQEHPATVYRKAA